MAARPWVVRRRGRAERHGVAASSLRELIDKARHVLAIENESVTLVVEEDGTIVHDDDYFLCLPPNTKFMVLVNNEKWPGSSSDSGTGWLAGPADEVDSAVEKWKQLARQLKDDLSNIILMSEEDIQVLIDVPCSDLAEELGHSQTRIQALQDGLQNVLDMREEERQSRQALELYHQVLTKEAKSIRKVTESETVPREEMDVVDVGTSTSGTSAETVLSDRILSVLKEKPSPELYLDSSDLELVVTESSQALASALRWNTQEAADLKHACDQELAKRHEQVQILRSLRSASKGNESLLDGDGLPSGFQLQPGI
ncbi:DNA fragmentation factor subunit alpha [Phaenicophaeus curvirostris]|uniref:DNA fragmentation factor subunit alpha n=1 Tax=Phaenicophaeus curvirostris TaxID=33595 RepID=UPI0037F0C367